MKKFIKYIFIFCVTLFLVEEISVKGLYAKEACYCPCGCNYRGQVVSSCKSCTCTNSCSCGRAPYPSCTCYQCSCYCACGCNYSSNGSVSSCKYIYNISACVNGGNKCTGVCTCPSDCRWGCKSNGACKCSNSCVSGCNSAGGCACSGCVAGCNWDGTCICPSSCNGHCTLSGSCSTSCDWFNCPSGYRVSWDSSANGCICVKNPVTCQSGYEPCGSAGCCAPGTYCGHDIANNPLCVAIGIGSGGDGGGGGGGTSNSAPTAPTGLQTEDIVNPTAVADTTPEFSAIFNDPDSNDSSSYYQIQVNTNADFTGTMMWNSEKKQMTKTLKGARSSQLSYAGTTLTLNGMTYYWRIKFWDAAGLESPWSTIGNFKMCADTPCDLTGECEKHGWTSTITSYQLKDIVFCEHSQSCNTEKVYKDCYEYHSPSICKGVVCNEGECCNVNGACGECANTQGGVQTLRLMMGSRISNIVEQRIARSWGNPFKKLISAIYAQKEYTNETNLGYVNSSASGLELNNPVPVEVQYSDMDGVNDMEAVYFWMTKVGEGESSATTNPPRYIDEIGDGSHAQTESNSSFGFMVRRMGRDWSNADIYIPEIVDAGNYWVKIGTLGNDFFIYGPNGLPMVKITNSELSSPNSNVLTLSFDMEFLNEYSGIKSYEEVYEGTYDTYTMVNDVFGFIPWDNYIYDEHVNLDTLRTYFSENEIRYYNKYQNMNLQWLVDLTPPAADAIRISVVGDNQLGIYWSVNDKQTGLGYVVGNVYRGVSSNSEIDSIQYLSPDAEKTYEIPVYNEETIGSLKESSLWKISYLEGETINAERTETIDILNNTGGSLNFYVTAIDKAGNYSILSKSFSLSPWIITKGGIVYSTLGTDIAIRLLDFSEGEGWLSNLWYSPDRDSYPNVEVFNPSLADLSSEVLAGNVDYGEDLKDLLHSTEIDGVYNKSIKVLHQIGLLRNSLYPIYKSKAEKQLSAIGAKTVPVLDDTTFTGKASDYCDGEYCVVNTEYNLTVDSGFVCDTKMLFLTSENITVRPNLMNEHNTDGCIFISGKNITIEEGTYASEGSTTPKYDIVEGYFIADGVITIESGDAGLDIKDGLQINGGLIGFGGSTKSIEIDRDMKLKYKIMYPVLAVHTSSSYGKIALKFFGPERSVYKQEVGYKPF